MVRTDRKLSGSDQPRLLRLRHHGIGMTVAPDGSRRRHPGWPQWRRYRARAGIPRGPVWLAARSVGDPEVVTVGIEEPEVSKTPRATLEILQQRPARGHHPVALSADVVDLEH
jgi:hypothetical protein